MTALAHDPLADDPRQTLRVGASIAAAFFIGLLGWAAVVPLDAGAHAQGVLRVSRHRQAVQTRDGGTITALHATEGDWVRQGQILVEIADDEVQASERGLAGAVFSLRAQQLRLLVERDGQQAIPDFDDVASLENGDRIIAAQALDLQRREFVARREAFVTQQAILVQRLRELDQQMIGSRRRIEAGHRQQASIGEELVVIRGLEAKGYATKTHVHSLERNLAALDGEVGAFEADYARTREAIGGTRLESRALDQRLTQEIAEQLRDVQQRLDEIRPRWTAVRSQLKTAIIRAPADGRVIGMTIFTVGGVAPAGQTLMEIVPSRDQLIVDAQLPPAEADDIAIGQVAQLRFTGLHERNLPALSGSVRRMSADAIVDDRSGSKFFAIEIAIPAAEIAKLRAVRGEGFNLQAGYPVDVVLTLRKRTALNYLLDPIASLLRGIGREN